MGGQGENQEGLGTVNGTQESTSHHAQSYELAQVAALTASVFSVQQRQEIQHPQLERRSLYLAWDVRGSGPILVKGCPSQGPCISARDVMVRGTEEQSDAALVGEGQGSETVLSHTPGPPDSPEVFQSSHGAS